MLPTAHPTSISTQQQTNVNNVPTSVRHATEPLTVLHVLLLTYFLMAIAQTQVVLNTVWNAMRTVHALFVISLTFFLMVAVSKNAQPTIMQTSLTATNVWRTASYALTLLSAMSVILDMDI